MTRGIIFTHSEMTGDLKPLYVYPSTLEENLIYKIMITSKAFELIGFCYYVDDFSKIKDQGERRNNVIFHIDLL